MSSPSTPDVPVLVAVTEQARATLGGRRDVRVTAWPFKVGREQRINPLRKLQHAIERRIGGHAPVNDLFLVEPFSDSLQISRAHFAITRAEGQYFVEDCGSTCGTGVNGQRLGGGAENPKVAPLNASALIVVGSQSSPYVFRFELRSSASRL